MPAAAIALILPVLYTVPLAVPSWGGRYLVLPLLAMGGLVVLSANRHSRLAQAAAAFLAVAALSTALSRQPHHAFFGPFGQGTGLLFIAAVVGAWALGGIVNDENGRRLVGHALLAAAAVNVLVAVAETAFDLSAVGMSDSARASGLLGNPVHLGALLAGATWFAVARFSHRGALPLLAAVALFSAGVQLSGSRAALLAVILSIAASALQHRRRAAIGALAVAIGLVGAGVFATGSGSSTARLANAAGRSSDGRVENWRMAAEALEDRPLFGAGPGRYQAATSRHRTARVGPDVYFGDAHNMAIEYAVTTGVLGLAALLLWAGMCWRRVNLSREPLAGFAAAVLIVHLLQPQNVAVTPLAFLALGAAGGGLDPPRWASAPLPARLAVAAGLIVALSASTRLGLGLYALNEARLGFEEPDGRTADHLLPRWSAAPERLARIYVLQSREQQKPELLDKALAARRRAAEDDPERIEPLIVVAQFEGQLGNLERMEEALRRALELDPWSLTANSELGLHLLTRGDRAGAEELLERSLRIDPAQERVRRSLDELRATDDR